MNTLFEIHKRGLIILFATGLLVLGVITFLVLSNRDDDTKIETISENNTSDLEEISITGYEKYPAISATDKKAAIKVISNYLRSDKLTIKGTNAQIRNGSYGEKKLEDSTVIEYIVDIPSIKRSYMISHTHFDNNDSNTYAFCLEKDKMIYPEFNCKDSTDV